MLKNQKGFTLIELLIVIVIIGILAGVLIAVINPAQQQNRAKDAGVQAAINKVALAAEGFVSAYGRAPVDTELYGSLNNKSDTPTASCTGGDGVCNFAITGNSLPVSCAANLWNGADTETNQCYFHYYGEVGTTHFRIAAKSFGIANTVFLYDNQTGEIVECSATAISDVNAPGSGCN